MDRKSIYALIDAERERQGRKFPNDEKGWTDPIGIKVAVLLEETGEVARAVLDEDYEQMRRELIDVAAVCVKWLERGIGE